MTQDNAPINPSQNQPPGEPVPPKKRRWIKRTILAVVTLVVLLLILVGITPALLSTGAGRTFVLGKINSNLNGHVTITDWSIGWTGGIRATDVKVFDADERQILQIPKFSAQLSLISVMRGQIHLGDTRVEGLDFFAERFPGGTLNFARLAKSAPEADHAEHQDVKAAGEKENAPAPTAAGPSKASEKTKLPVIDGDLQLINCRGTFQDDGNPDPKFRSVEFRTIAGEVKITSVNDPITDSLKIVAYAADGSQMLNFSADGKLQIARDNELLSPGQMQITQKIATSADLKRVQQGFGGMLPVQFTGGSIDATVDFSNDTNGITISPLVKGADIAYVKDGIAENVGSIYADGKVNMISPGGPSAKNAVTNITLSNLRMMGIGSAVVINGGIEDIEVARKFNNVTIDPTYNLSMLWDAYKPMLSKEQKESLKDVKVAGNYSKHFVINGSLPGDKPFNEAIAGLTVNGEFALDSFDGEGASLRNLIIPISVANGKLSIAYAGKTGAEAFAAPAILNSGKLSLAGATVDLTGKTMTLLVPDKTQFLSNVELNPVFTSTFLAGNPLFADAHKSSGLLSIEITHCQDFPLSDIVMHDVPENHGVIELNLKIQKVQIGNVLVAKLAQQFNATNLPFLNKLSLDSLSGDINEFNVLVQHGTSKQHLTLSIAGSKKPLVLDGTVALATQIMNMQMDLPLAIFGIKTGSDAGIHFPVTGPVSNPQFDIKGALAKNVTNIKGVPDPVKNLLGGGKSNPSTQPSDQKEDALKGLLNGLGKKKDDKGKD